MSASAKGFESDSPEDLVVSVEDEFGVWHHVERELSNYLPFRNVVWNSRIFDRIHLQFIVKKSGDEQIQTEPSFLPELVWLRNSSLYLYLFKCDDPDLYKDKIRVKLKAWIEHQQEKHREWLIVYVPVIYRSLSRSEATEKATRKILDRIRTDFNLKADRFSKLELADSSNEQWQDLVCKIKDAVLASIDVRCAHYDEEIKKLGANRHLPGWNYCKFFAAKEGLALLYEQLRMWEDALKQYDELESIYEENADNIGTKFERFGGTTQIDCSGDMFDWKQKPYQRMIYQNNGTEFDFRVYLFARQAHLLARLRMNAELATRCFNFVRSMSSHLRFYQRSLPQMFREVWMYQACFTAIARLHHTHYAPLTPSPLPTQSGPHSAPSQPPPASDASAPQSTQGSSGGAPASSHVVVARATGDLLLTARSALRNLWVQSSGAPQPIVARTDLPPSAPTMPALQHALDSRDSFIAHFLELTQQARRELAACGRTRVAVHTLRDAVDLLMSTSSIAQAQPLLTEMCDAYARDGWSLLLAHYVPMLAACYRDLGMHAEYIHTALRILRSPREHAVDEGAAQQYLEGIIGNAGHETHKVRADLSGLVAVSSVRVVDAAQRHVLGQQVTLQCVLTSCLPGAIHADRVTLHLTHPSNQPPVTTSALHTSPPPELTATACDLDILPACNACCVPLDLHHSGEFALTHVHVCLGALTLTASVAGADAAWRLHVMEAPPSLRVRLLPPACVFPGQKHTVRLHVSPPPSDAPQLAGASAAASPSALVVLSSSTNLLIHDSSRLTAYLCSTSQHGWTWSTWLASCTEGHVSIPPLAPDHSVVLDVSISCSPSDLPSKLHQLSCRVDCEAAEGRKTSHAAVVYVAVSAPFAPHHHLLPFASLPRAIVQVQLMCVSPSALQVISCTPATAPACILAPDPNHTLLPMTAMPHHRLFLVFVLDAPSTDTSRLNPHLRHLSPSSHPDTETNSDTPLLSVSVVYAFAAASKTAASSTASSTWPSPPLPQDVFGFTYVVPANALSPVWYTLSCAALPIAHPHPTLASHHMAAPHDPQPTHNAGPVQSVVGAPVARVGEALQLCITVGCHSRQRGTWSAVPRSLLCQIETDAALWITAGKTKHRLCLQPGQHNELQATIVPVVPGMVPLPAVTLSFPSSSLLPPTVCGPLANHLHVLASDTSCLPAL